LTSGPREESASCYGVNLAVRSVEGADFDPGWQQLARGGCSGGGGWRKSTTPGGRASHKAKAPGRAKRKLVVDKLCENKPRDARVPQNQNYRCTRSTQNQSCPCTRASRRIKIPGARASRRAKVPVRALRVEPKSRCALRTCDSWGSISPSIFWWTVAENSLAARISAMSRLSGGLCQSHEIEAYLTH
jgi:hypothetical protein